jgi:hypothetical protein
MLDYLNLLYSDYCILSSKNDKPIKNKTIVYNYTCCADHYSDILEATRLMLLYNCKIIDPSLQKNKGSNIEWSFYTTNSEQEIRNMLKKQDRSNFIPIIKTIKFKNDLK